jgi:hypothetical protein
MAGSFSDYLENAVLSWIKGTAMPTAPAAVYVALFSAESADGATVTEVTTTIRIAGRVAATFGAVGAGSGTAKRISNSAIVDFGTAAGSASLTGLGLFDAASSGNLLAWADLTTPMTASTGNLVSFAAGALTVDLD